MGLREERVIIVLLAMHGLEAFPHTLQLLGQHQEHFRSCVLSYGCYILIRKYLILHNYIMPAQG